MPDGRRQILTILIPGDFFDLHGFLLKTMDHSVATFGATRIAAIGRETVRDILLNHPRIGAALWWSAMQEQAMMRERIVALGRRSARGRLAYFLCELVWRSGRSAWPRITQSGCLLRRSIWPTRWSDLGAHKPRPAELPTGRADHARTPTPDPARHRAAASDFRPHPGLPDAGQHATRRVALFRRPGARPCGTFPAEDA